MTESNWQSRLSNVIAWLGFLCLVVAVLVISLGLFLVSVGNRTWIEFLDGLLDEELAAVLIALLMTHIACATINYLFIGRFRFLPWR